MNNNWKKELGMSYEEKIALHDLRLTQHDEVLKDTKTDIKEIKEVLFRLDKKLNNFPEGGLQCNIHNLRMEDYSKRLAEVELRTEKLNTKIITWTAVASVILFILSQLVFPYLLNNMKNSEDGSQRSEYVEPNYGIYTTNSVLNAFIAHRK